MLLLVSSFQAAEAESFMDIWLSQQKLSLQDDWLSKQVASQVQATMPSSSQFNQEQWLARQQAKTETDWLAQQATSQASSSSSFNKDEWLAHQEEMASQSDTDTTLSQSSWT